MRMLLLTLLAVCACYGSQPNPHHPQMKPDAFTGISNNENQGKPSSSINPSATVVHVKIRETDPISRNVQSERSSLPLSDSSNSVSTVSKSNEFPYEERIESMLFLTNALILTEAVRSKKLNMSQVVIDLMIIGQFEGMNDWFEVLNSAAVDAENLKRIDDLFDELGPLHDAIENGFSEILDTEVLRSAVSIMNSIQVINNVIDDAKNYGEMLESFGRKAYITVDEHSETLLDSLVNLPKTLKAFKDVTDRISALDHVNDGIELVRHMKQLESSFSPEITSFNSSQNAARSLYTGITSLTIPEDPKLKSILDAVAVVKILALATEVSDWKELLNLVDDLNKVIEQLKLIGAFREKKMNAIKHITKFRVLITKFENLKNFSKNLLSVKKVLTIFKPIQEIVEQFKNIYHSSISQSGVSKVTTVSFLKVFEGLPDGMKSIESLTKRIGPFHAIPTQILRSKIAQRVEIIESLVADVSPMIGSRDEFKNINRLWKIVNTLEHATATKTSEDLKMEVDKIAGYYAAIPQIDEIQTSLENSLAIISSFKKNNWTTNFTDVLDSYTAGVEKPIFEKLSDALHFLPEFIKFASKLKTSFGPLSSLNDTYDVNNEVMKTVRNMAGEFEHGMNISKKLLSVKVFPHFPKSDILIVKENFAKSTGQLQLNLVNQNYTSDEILRDLEASNAVTIPTANKPVVEGFITRAVDFSSFMKPTSDVTNSASNFVKPEEIESVKNLLEAVSTSRLNKTQIEKSDHISKLMEETPSGYKFLNSMRAGVMNYRKFSDGYAAFLEFKNYVDKRRKRFMRHVDQSNLVNYIGKMFESVKPIAINGNDSTVYGLLRDFSSFMNPLAKFAADSKNIKVENKLIIRKDLEDLMVELKINPTMKRRLQQIGQLVNILEDTFSDKISKLVSGLKDFYSILTFVDCVKEPTLAECIVARAISASSTSTSGIDIWWIIVAGVIVSVIVIAVVVAILCQKKHHADVETSR